MSRDEQVEARARELVMAAYAEAGMQPQPWFLHDDPASFRGSDYFLFKAITEALRGASGGGVRTLTYRGWTIHQGSWPEPTWMATGPHYDASYEGPEDGWVDNGQKADGSTIQQIMTEIDGWFEEHGDEA